MFGNGFYNPYIYQPQSYYNAANIARGLSGISNASRMGGAFANTATGSSVANGIGRGLLGKFSFSGLLNGASKTLNVINQAIPIFYQVKPMINNAKTMFRIMGAVKDDDSPKTNLNQRIQNNNKEISSTNSATRTVTYNEPIMEQEISADNPVFFI